MSKNEKFNKKERNILRKALAHKEHRAFGNWTLLWGLASRGFLVSPTATGLVWTLTEAGLREARALPATETQKNASRALTDIEQAVLLAALHREDFRAYGEWDCLWDLNALGFLKNPGETSGAIWALTESGIVMARTLQRRLS